MTGAPARRSRPLRGGRRIGLAGARHRRALLLAAWLLVADASQGILTGALRGAADIWACIGVQFVCFWLICIPFCYLLAHRLDLGVAGLLWGLFVGLLAAALPLAWRFKALAAREVRPL